MFVTNTILLIHFIKSVSDIAELASNVGNSGMQNKKSKLQRNRNNIPSESICHYSKKVVTIPSLNHSAVEIERRFDHGSISVYSGLAIIFKL